MAETLFLHVVISLAILLFTAKVFAEIFHRLKLPVVLGELLAGIVVGPFALGTFVSFDGRPIVVLDETIRQIGELSAIVILFIAGLEITPREFLRGGAACIYCWLYRCCYTILFWLLCLFSIWNTCSRINAYSYCHDCD